jgi:hypothetical protein
VEKKRNQRLSSTGYEEREGEVGDMYGDAMHHSTSDPVRGNGYFLTDASSILALASNVRLEQGPMETTNRQKVF